MRKEPGRNLTDQKVSWSNCGILRGRSCKLSPYPRYFLPNKRTALNDAGGWLRGLGIVTASGGFFTIICSNCCWPVEGEI